MQIIIATDHWGNRYIYDTYDRKWRQRTDEDRLPCYTGATHTMLDGAEDRGKRIGLSDIELIEL